MGSRRFLKGSSGGSLPTTLAEEKAYFTEVGESGYTWTASDSGRSFARCYCDLGTIMKWNDNSTTRYTIILDAEYRTSKALYSDYTTNLDLTTHTNTGEIDSDYERKSAENYTDAILNAKTFCTQDIRSSTLATNEWANSSYYGTNMAAAYYVRNTLASTAKVLTDCDLPTIDCLARIWADAALLDSMDPTVSTYNTYNLTDWSFGGACDAWSSSWQGNGAEGYWGLIIWDSGYVDGFYQNYNCCVIPVLELV